MFNTKKIYLKLIPDITFTLYIYDIFALYTRWNIYTNQMKVKNYTSWNIKTKPIILVTYTSRCRKLHLKLSTLPVFWWVKLRGSTLYEGLTVAIGTGLQRRHVTLWPARHHMKDIPDQIFIHKANLQWNLPDQIFIHKANLRWNLTDQIFIHESELVVKPTRSNVYT